MAHVTFIHGIGNKPPAGLLHDLWLHGLATGGGPDLPAAGITSAMVSRLSAIWPSSTGRS